LEVVGGEEAGREKKRKQDTGKRFEGERRKRGEEEEEGLSLIDLALSSFVPFLSLFLLLSLLTPHTIHTHTFQIPRAQSPAHSDAPTQTTKTTGPEGRKRTQTPKAKQAKQQRDMHRWCPPGGASTSGSTSSTSSTSTSTSTSSVGVGVGVGLRRVVAVAARAPAARRPLAGRRRPAALPSGNGSSGDLPGLRALNPSPSGGLDPALEAAVPVEQRPHVELQQLKSGALYAWATLPEEAYAKRLAAIFAFFFAFIGGPVAYQTFDPSVDPLAFALSGSVGSLVVVSAAAARVYLGWRYVGDRLLSAAYPYEESGWYDGQTFVKPPPVLARDRLLGAYEVRPTLAKLRRTLLGCGALLLGCAVVLSALIKTGADADGMYGRAAARPEIGERRKAARTTPDGVLFGTRASSLSQLMQDDELAAEEAAAMGGLPGYCSDRVLKTLAGGGAAACPDF
jgi:hypothetical protein